jgi:hypothetical protein
MKSGAIPSEHYCSFILPGDANLDSILRKQGFDQFRPFHEAIIAGIEIIFIPDVKNLRGIFDPVKIEMINRIPGNSLILIDDGKGGTLNEVLHAELLADRLYKRGFAGSHATIESKHPGIRKSLQQFPGCGR